MALVTKLKEYRERDDLKQVELADNWLGLGDAWLIAKMDEAEEVRFGGNLEKGKYNPSLKLAMDIAKVFHTTVEELFAYTED